MKVAGALSLLDFFSRLSRRGDFAVSGWVLEIRLRKEFYELGREMRLKKCAVMVICLFAGENYLLESMQISVTRFGILNYWYNF